MSDTARSERPTLEGPSSVPPRPGHPTEVAGRYRILGRLGDGGMGVVYRAEHVLSKKKLALKLLHPHLSHGKQAVERFRREVSAAAEIDHPGIVQVFDAGMDADGSFYMAMELLEGESLGSLMKRDWPGTRRAIELVLELCAPLARAHDKGFIHRDLKPDNVFLARDPETGAERVKLLDFGLAREITKKGATDSGVTFGTPEYMAPEQSMSAKNAATPADVWSVGVMLYELLSGFHPFTGDSPNAIMVAAITTPHAPLHERAPHVPRAICEVVERALDKNVSRRTPTAGQLSQELRSAVEASQPLDDRRPERTHRMDEHAAESDEAPPDMTGIPAADDAAIARSRQLGRERGISTEPRTRPPEVGGGSRMVLVLGGIVVVLALLALGTWALTHAGPPEMSATSLASPTSLVPTALTVPASLTAPATTLVPPSVAPPETTTPPSSATEAALAPPSSPSTTEGAPGPDAPDVPELVPPSSEASTPVPETPRPRTRVPSLTTLSPEDASRARDCLAHNDFPCAIAIYRTSRDPHDLRRVVDALDHLGRHREALGAMQDFVRRFPSAPESGGYRAQLEAAGM